MQTPIIFVLSSVIPRSPFPVPSFSAYCLVFSASPLLPAESPEPVEGLSPARLSRACLGAVS